MIRDAHIRKQALNPQESFIVEAPAGSGKTELLVQRFLSLLATSVRYPEEILAITFTRKAAHEMRTRIIVALEKARSNDTQSMQTQTVELAQQVLKKDAQENWQLLENANRLCVQTIDALCMRLTQQMPIISGMGGNAQMSSHPDDLYLHSVQAILTSIDDEVPWQKDLIAIFKHFDNQYAVIESVFVDMLKRRDQWLPYIVGIHDEQLLKKQFEHHLENIVQDRIQKVHQCFPKDIAQALLPLAQYAGHDWQTWPSQTVDALPQWLGMAELLLTKDGDYRKQVDKRIGFPADAKNDYKKRMQELLLELQAHDDLRQALVLLREAPPLRYTENSWEILQALLTVLPIMAAQLLLTFQRQGQVDFIEVARRALQALGEEDNPTDLALILDYQLQHILVDEFQDTSMTQYRLLEKMVAAWQPNDGHTLFLVGDPMQSIYRFRQANVGLFLKAKQEGIGAVTLTPLVLCMNFRSLPTLIDSINQIMPSIMPSISDMSMGAISFTPCVAAKQDSTDGVLKPFLVPDALTEAQLLLSELKVLKQKHPDWCIAILVRARSHLTEILPQLKAHDIAYQALEIEPLMNNPLINDLLALTRALLHYYDNIAWLALLRAPFCGLELGEIERLATFDETRPLWDIIQDQTALQLLSVVGQERLMRFRGALAPTLNARGRLPLARWVESAWIALGAAYYTTEKDLSDIEAFYNLLSVLEKEYQWVDVHQLTAHVSRLYTNQLAMDVNAVQVMTIHKAKGLEFDAVFLPGLSRRSAANSPSVLKYVEQTSRAGAYWLLAPIHAKTAQVDPIYHYLTRVEKHQEAYETQRLLYVALTRAKQQLYLFAVGDEKQNPSAGSLWALLVTHLQPITYAQQLISSSERSNDKEHPGAENLKLYRLPITWQLPQPWFDWLFLQTTTPIEDNTVDITPYEPHVLMRKHVGTLLHRILKYITEKNLLHWREQDIKNQIPRWHMQLLELGVCLNEINTALTLLTQAVQNILTDPQGQWILQSHSDSACEYPLNIGNKKIIIDRTFVFNNERWIIDYKSGAEQEEISVYIAQLQYYAHVFKQIDSRPIRLGLYFPLTMTWKEIICNSSIVHS